MGGDCRSQVASQEIHLARAATSASYEAQIGGRFQLGYSDCQELGSRRAGRQAGDPGIWRGRHDQTHIPAYLGRINRGSDIKAQVFSLAQLGQQIL
jgi:hypothetical protein